MRLEDSIENSIASAISDIEIKVRLDGDNDLEVTLLHNGKQISQDFVVLDDAFVGSSHHNN